jgi:hypothetical protein
VADAVHAGLPGDVDGDCDVDIKDVVLLERSLAGHVELTDEQAANANLAPIGGGAKDKSVDVGDLVTIKRIVARDAEPATPLALPVITTPNGDAQTTSNPWAISGTAPSGATITVYVNGRRHPHEVTATGGNFAFSGGRQVPLNDGENSITVVASTNSGANQSCSSQARELDYVPQPLTNPPPALATNSATVWTAGRFGGNPVDFSSNYSVPNGAVLWVQPGVVLRFGTNNGITVQGGENGGNLQIVGSATQKVSLGLVPSATCNPSGGTSSAWSGITINSNPSPGNLIEHVVIDCTWTGLTVGSGDNGAVTFRDSEIRRWGSLGVQLHWYAVSALIQRNEMTFQPGSTAISVATANGAWTQILDNRLKGGTAAIGVTNWPPNKIAGNWIEGGSVAAIRMNSNTTFSAPFEITNNTVTKSCRGIYKESGQPTVQIPVVNHNNIFDNNICSGGCGSSNCKNYISDGDTCGLDAQKNWWGTTDAALIQSRIHGPCGAVSGVDYVPFLSAPWDQNPVEVGDGLFQGTVYDGMPNGPDFESSEWILLDTVIVPANQTLTIPDGKTLKFAEDAELVVQGTLEVSDTLAADVLFTSLPPEGVSKAPGDWKGITVQAGGRANVRDAVIEYASTALKVTGTDSYLEVTGSLVQHFNQTGIRIEDLVESAAGDAGAYIHDNRNGGLGIFAASTTTGIAIQNVDADADLRIDNNEIENASYAVDIEDASPKLRGNLIRTSNMGIHISGAGAAQITSKADAPEIPGNEITGNCRGIYVRAPNDQPLPVVRENKIHANTKCGSNSHSYYIESYGWEPVLSLDAERNFWGTNLTTAAISATIHDREEGTIHIDLPTVDFIPFYPTTAMDPLTLIGNGMLLGPVQSNPNDPNDVLPPGTYTAVGTLVVDDGQVWRLGPGVTIEFESDYALDVDGSLVIAGTAGSPVTLGKTGTPHWTGIVAHGPAPPGKPKLDIRFATIGNAVKGIEVEDTTDPVTIADSAILGSHTGIHLIEAGDASEPVSIARTDINGASYAGGWSGSWGVVAHDSTFILDDDNEIWNLGTGVVVTGAGSQPTIGTSIATGNTIRSFSSVGIQFIDVPGGTIVGNEIFNSASANPLIGTGIQVNSSSPAIRLNHLHDLDIGIHVVGDSSPVIGEVSPSQPPHNTITANRIGIRVEGEWWLGFEVQPTPIIRRNNLGGNDEADLEVVDYPPGFDQTLDAKENHWGSTDPATIRSRIRLDTTSPVGVEYANYLPAADSMSPENAPALFSTVLTQVARSAAWFTPTLPTGNTVNVSTVVLGAGADVTLDIYGEDDDLRTNLIYRETKTNVTGPQTFTWDGRYNQGVNSENYVENEAYIYVLSAGGGQGTFDPPRPTQDGSTDNVGANTDSYNVFENRFQKLVFDMNNVASRTSFQMYASQSGNLIRTLAWGVPFARTDTEARPKHYFAYDGRDEQHVLESHAEESRYFFVTPPTALRPNHVIVERVRPRIQPENFAPEASTPVIEVKSDPYLVINSYDQVSTIAYQLDQVADVTIQILDPTMTPVGAPLVSGASQGPGTTYIETWSGVDALTAGGLYDLIDGNYTFAITAVNPSQSSLTTTYRGVIQVRQ